MSTPADRSAGIGRLSVSKLQRRPSRDLTLRELETFTLIADTLIPGTEDNPAGSAVKNFSALVTQAVAILDSRFEQLTSNLAELAAAKAEEMWERLRELSVSRPDDFYWLSTVVVAAYLYAPEIKEKLGYPTPHPNPADMFEVAEELSSGILEPVIQRGPVYITSK